jgi:hypothetical protein
MKIHLLHSEQFSVGACTLSILTAGKHSRIYLGSPYAISPLNNMLFYFILNKTRRFYCWNQLTEDILALKENETSAHCVVGAVVNNCWRFALGRSFIDQVSNHEKYS